MLPRFRLILVALLFCSHAIAQRNYNLEFAWGDTAHYTQVDENKYVGGTVILRDLDFQHLGSLPQTNPGESVVTNLYGTQHNRVIRYHFRTQAAIDAFLKEERRVPQGFEVRMFDARIIRPDGQVEDLSTEQCLLPLLIDPVSRGGYRSYAFKDLVLHPGDQFEMVQITRTSVVRMVQEVRIQDAFPIMEKQLVINSWDLPKLDVLTYNGFPPMEVERIGARILYRWTFHDLEPVPYAPYQVSLQDQPFYSLSMGRHMHPDQRLNLFIVDHRYTRLSGRKHQHTFLDHLNARRQVLGAANHTDIVRDIVAFIRDSVAMVPDEEVDNNEPVGWHFRQRTLSEEKLLQLYRQMFSVMNIPMYVCFVRDRYLSSSKGPDIDPEDLAEYIFAFKDERNGGVHFLALNTLSNTYLVDEIPYWLTGQMALLMEYDELKKDPETRWIKLPEARASDNLLLERFRVEVKDGSLPICTAKGAVTGAMRQCWDADPSAHELSPYLRPDLRSPHLRHVSIDSVTVEQKAAVKLSYQATPLLPVIDTRSDGDLELLEVDLERMIAAPSFGTSGNTVLPNSLLPYPYVQRYDVIITFPTDVELMGTNAPLALDNTFGTLNMTCEQRDPRTIHWHLDHGLTNTWVDRSMQPLYLALVGPIADPATFKFVVKKL